MRSTPSATTRLRRTLLAVVLLLPLGCAVNPATGERQLLFMGQDREIEIGRQSDPGIVAQYGLYPDSAVQKYVRDLGLRLAAASEFPNLPWTFRVLDDPTINAFALPGGFVYVTRGILAHFENEAQLAGVLGHEIGHVTGRHGAEQMSRGQVAQLGMIGAAVLSETARDNFGLLQAGVGLGLLSYGRADENQADELGVRYMTRLDYDPRELAGVMEMLDASSQVAAEGARLPEWQSTHPYPANRVEAILSQVERNQLVPADPVVDRQALIAQLDGLVYGPNPREGYLEDGIFHHPDLAFRFMPPAGWRVQNQKQAVVAISEQQDAIFQLTIAQEEPLAAARAFVAQQGVRATTPVEQTINGLPFAFTNFTADSEQGPLEGQVGFVRYGDLTYQLLGYAPASRWADRGGAVRGAIRSFDRETSPSVLDVQPARIAVVPLSGPEPMSAFLERYPSSAPDIEVALLNQVAVDGVLRGGSAKRVVGGR